MRVSSRRLKAVATLLLAGISLGEPAGARDEVPPYFASDNVEHVAHIPLNNDSAGARVVEGYLYITTSRDLKIYDLGEPAAPVLAGELILPQLPYFAEEDVDTNGEILLIDGPNGPLSRLYVIDVEDKSNPTIVGEMGGAGADQHTFSCILDCSWAYGSRGAVVDLRDPTRPRHVADWRDAIPLGNARAHDVTEVAPGLVVTSSDPIMLLDARSNPRKPKVLAMATSREDTSGIGYFWAVHGNEWPRRGKDRFLLTSGESAGPNCEEGAAFFVWDTRGWQKTRTFRVLNGYRPNNGLPSEGDVPADLLCSHWFQAHPDFRDSGAVAIGWYDHGVRFLHVSKVGTIEEVGYFMRPGGSMSAAYWATREIVYAVDYHYGLDVLRFRSR